MYKITFTLIKAICLLVLTISSFSLSAQCLGITSSTRDAGTVSGTDIVYNITVTFGNTNATNVNLAIVTQLGGTGSLGGCATVDCQNIPVVSNGSITFQLTVDNPFGVYNIEFEGIGYPGSSGDLCVPDILIFPEDTSLPADLIAFEGSAEERMNKLSWQTASEENVAAFQVESSLDGRAFNPIGSVQANGNTENLSNYIFVDEAPLSLSYYRLKIVDFDGSFEYSDIVTIERSKSDIAEVEVFPVPAVNEEVTVLIHSKSSGKVLVDLFDMTGKILEQSRLEVAEGINPMTINLPESANNIYFLTIYNGTDRISKTIVKSTID